MDAEHRALLEIRGLTKHFPGVKALQGVDFSVRRGEIHALMGENGAGKSTLIKVLTGVYPRDAGQIQFDGADINPHSPKAAAALGISTVYQEVNLIPHLSVAENICLGREPTRLGMLRWRAMTRRAVQAMARVDLQLDVSRSLSSYSIAVQQLVAIARALDVANKLLILDEPTSSLDEKEVEELFAVLRKLRLQGIGIVLVTHFLDQVYAISDRITVLRDGKLVGAFETARLPKLKLVSHMIGREISSEAGPVRQASSTAPGEAARPLLELKQFGRSGSVAPMDLTISPGEVVGLAGLLGSGRTETARLIFGVDRAQTGEMRVNGRKASVRSPRQAIRHGFGFTPENRKAEGLIPHLSVRENIVLALQAQRGAARRIPHERQVEIAEDFIRLLGISTPGPEQVVSHLSGGNQQKVLLARWLATQPRLLILDEPTRGIDVGAKAEIEKTMQSLRAQGLAIVFISSEWEEIVRSCERVVVLRDRCKVGELARDQISEENIMHLIAGHGHGAI